ncbi:MAG: 2OG-Fe(II) oxygenase [Cytophagaceae bacterium]|nr:2OG-Fe(II) oxygenase [Cytophagaceae bacterium]MDW8455849.1 2OG-Fe(II) oxygenase family protein [Cytophagaceae bacterium]
MNNHINPAHLEPAAISSYHKQFQENKPYKHIVLDNFLVPEFATILYENFPGYDKLNKAYKGYNEYKAEGSNFSDFNENFLKLRNTLASQDFYQWISSVTGIKDVFITDDKLGAGLHQGLNGSFLDIHIDFNIHPSLNVHRRLNLLIYLQKDWKPEYNGALELWNSDMSKCEKKVFPEFNRCVIFETSEISYHGYTEKINVPDGVTRKSFYAYFYTNDREDAVEYHDTYFRAKPEDPVTKKVITSIKERLKNGIKAGLKKVGFKVDW